MNWITLTASDLNDVKVAALVTAARTAALASGQSDPVDRVIAEVTQRIRTEIAAKGVHRTDTDTTKIPSSLRSLAARMIVRQLQSRLKIQLTEDERTEQKNDLRYLERIAANEVAVETPDNPVTPQIESGVGAQFVAKPRRTTRTSLTGL